MNVYLIKQPLEGCDTRSGLISSRPVGTSTLKKIG